MAFVIYPMVEGDLGLNTKNSFVGRFDDVTANLTPTIMQETTLQVGDSLYLTDSANVSTYFFVDTGFVLVAYSKGGLTVAPTAYTPVLGATVTPPTRGGTFEEKAWFSITNGIMSIQYFLENLSAGVAGSGAYTWALPAGFAIDTSLVDVNASSTENGSIFGSAKAHFPSNIESTGVVLANSSTELLMFLLNLGVTESGQFVSDSFFAMSGPASVWSFDVTIPVVAV